MTAIPASLQPAATNRALVLTARERTLTLEAIAGSDDSMRIIAIERECAGNALVTEIVSAADIRVVTACGESHLSVGRHSFSLAPKGLARVQAWLSQLQMVAP